MKVIKNVLLQYAGANNTQHKVFNTHLPRQRNNSPQQIAPHVAVNAMDFFLPVISNSMIIHVVPEGKFYLHSFLLVSIGGGADLEILHKQSTPGGCNQTWIMAYKYRSQYHCHL